MPKASSNKEQGTHHHHTSDHEDIEASALHTTLDPSATFNSEPTHSSTHMTQPHIDPTPLWTHTNSEARATDIDALEVALMSFTLTPEAYLTQSSASTVPLYDVNNSSRPSSSSYTRHRTYNPTQRPPSHNGIRIQSNIAKAYSHRDDKFATDMHRWRNKVSISDIRRGVNT